jgi:hypothetical protein
MLGALFSCGMQSIANMSSHESVQPLHLFIVQMLMHGLRILGNLIDSFHDFNVFEQLHHVWVAKHLQDKHQYAQECKASLHKHKLKSIQKSDRADSIALLSRLLVNVKVPHVKWPCYPMLLGEPLDVYGSFEKLNCTALLADLKLQSETIHKPFTIAEIGVIHDRQDSLLLNTKVVRAMVSLKSFTQLGSRG